MENKILSISGVVDNVNKHKEMCRMKTNNKIKNMMRVGLDLEINNKIENLGILKRELEENAQWTDIHCIRHNDLDGIGVEIVMQEIQKVTGAKITFYEDSPNADASFEKILKEKTAYDFILISDLSFSSKEYIDDKLSNCIDLKDWLILLDHHRSASFMNEYDFALVKEHNCKEGIITSGTLLTFYAFKDILLKKMSTQSYMRLEQFVNAVAAYDTYFFKEDADLSDSLYGSLPNDLNIVFKYYKERDTVDDFIQELLSIIDNNEPLVIEKMATIIDTQKSNIDNEIRRAIENATIEDNVAIYYYSGPYVSEIGNALCNHYKIYYAMIIDLNNEKVSMRTTIDDLDLTKLISHIKGSGGHPKACGFTFNAVKANLKELLRNLMKRDN